ncbi:MAG: diaminopimelate epimerase [Chlorobia bacterium]|nr:diaminopimelate epimerase [Fimbriimonadaceae bacterium]
MLGLTVGQIPFWKFQAIGNDFPLFHASDLDEVDLSELAISAANRQFGIGGDGILVMKPLGENRAELRMFNPDGTEDFCGNGLRIAARHAFDEGWTGAGFTLVHRGQDVPSQVLPNGQILTTIGTASYAPSEVPVNRPTELFDDVVAVVDGKEIRGSSLSTGSTHTVIPVDVLPSDDEIASLGSQLEYLPIFPDRTSVIFAKEIAPNELQIRIWERGVGETLGCGTGSSAAAADYLRRRDAGGKVLVQNPGGEISVSMDAWDRPITVQGEASLVYRGNLV